MNATVIGLIAIPIAFFVLSAIYGAVRGSIQFARYLVRSEESQRDSAESLKEISELLSKYMEKTDKELREQAERLTVVEFALLGKTPGRSVRGIPQPEP